MSRPFLFFLVTLGLAACGPTEISVDGGMPDDAGTGGPAGRIEVESSAVLSLMYGESTEVIARYTEGGAPRAGVEVRFALEGLANDSTLGDLEVLTDGEGRARTTFVAGTVDGSFRLRISADRAPSANIDVSVSDLGFGTIVVDAHYVGNRGDGARRLITVYSGIECDSPDGFPASAVARVASLEDASVRAEEFNTLAVGQTYTVVGEVQGAAGATLATACVDRIEVRNRNRTNVRLLFSDAELIPDGDYDVELSVSADAYGGVAALGVDAGVSLATTGATELLDALEEELRNRSLMMEAEALAAERMTGTPEMELDAELSMRSTDPIEAFRRFFDRLLELLTAVRIGGRLELALDGPTGASAALIPETLLIGPSGLPDGPAPLSIDLAAAGLEEAPVLGMTWRGEADEVLVDSLSVALPLTTLLNSAVDVALADSASSPGSGLRELAGCGALLAWVSGRPELAACDSACVDTAYVAALDRSVDAAQGAITSEPSLDILTLTGSIQVFDDDGDLGVDRLEGTLPGTWAGGDPVPVVDAVGTLTGVRTVD